MPDAIRPLVERPIVECLVTEGDRRKLWRGPRVMPDDRLYRPIFRFAARMRLKRFDPSGQRAELRFEFSEDCWLEVTDADEDRLAYRLYRAGDVARLRGKAPLQVFLGNAEGVRLTVNGAPIAVRPAARRDGTARLTVGGGAG